MSNSTIERFGTTRRYSDVVVHASTVYLVEVPATLGTDITTQTREVLASVEQLLKKAGSDKSRLLIVTLYLRDMADYNAMNTVWDAWVPEGHPPARATVEAKLAKPEYKVEIQITACNGMSSHGHGHDHAH